MDKNNRVKKFKIYFAKEEIVREIEKERMDAFYNIGSNPRSERLSEWSEKELKKRYGGNAEFLNVDDKGGGICVVEFLRLIKKKVLYTTEEEIEIKKGGKIDECAKKVLNNKYGAEVEFIKAETI